MPSVMDKVRGKGRKNKGKEQVRRPELRRDEGPRRVASVTIIEGRGDVVRPTIGDFGSAEKVANIVETAIARQGSFYNRQEVTLPAAGTDTLTINSGVAGVDYPVAGLLLTIAPPTNNTKGVVGIDISVAGNWYDGDAVAPAQEGYIKFHSLAPVVVLVLFGEVNASNSSKPIPRALRARDAAHASPDIVVTFTAPEGTTILQETLDVGMDLHELLRTRRG